MAGKLLSPLLLFVYPLFYANACERDSRNVVDTQVPRLSPTEEVEVYFMRAPLLKNRFKDNLADLGLYHASVGIRLRGNRSTWTFEFDAVSFTGALLPTIVNDTDLIWNVGSEVCLETDLEHNPLRMLYWTTATLVTILNGAQYNDFVDWVEHFARNPPLYQSLNVFSAEMDPPQMWRQAVTCGDFVWDAFSHLKDSIGAELRPMVQPSTTSMALLKDPSKAPEVVDSTSDGDVVAFYKALSTAMADMASKGKDWHLGDLMRAALELKKAEFYIFISGTKYLRVYLRRVWSPIAILVYSPPDLFASEVRTYPSLGITAITWAGNVTSHTH